jgi:arylsulfatase A-like enzyme/tetratricopeptide (TPR) repeat protein
MPAILNIILVCTITYGVSSFNAIGYHIPVRRVNRLLLLSLAGPLALAACQSGERAIGRKGQNVLLVTIDTLRPDHLGAYGYREGRTPRLDALAREGVVFDDVTSQVPVTLPSHASLLTGMVPPTHGVRDNTYFRLDDSATTLAEVMRAHGYETAAFVGAYVLNRSFGLAQGFDHYDDELPGAGSEGAGTIADRRAEDVTRAFLSWLRGRAEGRPFFAWIHYFDPHLPYAPPSPYRESFAAHPYDGEIAYVDEQLGRVLDAVDALDGGRAKSETLVVVTSDHGESLGEHGETSHGFFVYDSTLHVPLLLRQPGSLPGGRRVKSPARTIDIFETVLQSSSIPIPTGAQGRSLLPLPESDEPAERASAYSECYVSELNFHWAPLVALRDGGYKYIEAPRPELYDLGNDPGETKNLADRQPDRLGRMRAALSGMIDSFPKSLSSRLQPDPKTVERLRSLGYAGSGGGRVEKESEARELPDPKDQLHLWTRLEEIILARAAGDLDGAASSAREVLAEDPTNLLALELLASVRSIAGDRGEAIELYRRILRIDPTRPLTHVTYGNLQWQSGDVEGAEKSFVAAIELDPKMAAAHLRLGELYLATGRAGKAKASFGAAAAIDGADPRVRLGLARTEEALGNQSQAAADLAKLHDAFPGDAPIVSELARAIALGGDLDRAVGLLKGGPDDQEVHYTLSVLYRSQGKMDEALAELDRSLSLDPRSATALHDRGVILSRMGRLPEAVTALESALALRDLPATENALATALCRMDRCGEAIPHFERAVRDAPDFVDAISNLSQAYEIAGRRADADRMKKRAAALESRR